MRKTKFLIVGFLNTGLDFCLFTISTTLFGFNAVLSNIVSFGTAIIFSYFLNRNWTFDDSKDDNKAREFSKFLISNISSLILNTAIVWLSLWILHLNFHFDAWIIFGLAKGMATCFSLVLNFTLFSRWVFKNY